MSTKFTNCTGGVKFTKLFLVLPDGNAIRKTAIDKIETYNTGPSSIGVRITDRYYDHLHGASCVECEDIKQAEILRDWYISEIEK